MRLIRFIVAAASEIAEFIFELWAHIYLKKRWKKRRVWIALLFAYPVLIYSFYKVSAFLYSSLEITILYEGILALLPVLKNYPSLLTHLAVGFIFSTAFESLVAYAFYGDVLKEKFNALLRQLHIPIEI